ncbi:MAG: methyltransferase domain-containing protein [Betaproteobacteria bacterium]|nr:methyltransferase domain-containing protein [Betaproteobacteria bacterium]
MSETERVARATAHYRDLAPRYDRATRLIDGIRRRAMAALDLRPGDVVIDAGCGTGWCLPYLLDAVGPSGQVIGFDPSDDMLSVARARQAVRDAGNILLSRGAAHDVELPRGADAVLFSYTHDLTQSAQSLRNVLGAARPGARVAATSTKLYARWLWPLNAYLRWSHREYITDFRHFDAPWTVLADFLDDFRVDTGPFTQHYVARGRLKSGLAR